MPISPYVRIPLTLAAVLLTLSDRPRSMDPLTLSNGIYLVAGLLLSVVLHYFLIFGFLSLAGLLAPWKRAVLGVLLPSLLLGFVFSFVDLGTMEPGGDLSQLALIAPGFVLVRLKALLIESLGWAG